MKFLAILKDSYREAVDAKVFFVMVIMSVLMVVFGFSVSFKPAPARQFFEKTLIESPPSPPGDDGELHPRFELRVIDTAGFDLNDTNKNLLKVMMVRQLTVEEFAELSKRNQNAGKGELLAIEQLDAKEQNSPDSRYRLLVAVDYARPARAEEIRRNPTDGERQVQEHFGRFGDLQMFETQKVTYIPPGSKDLPKNLQGHTFQAGVQTPFGAGEAAGVGAPRPGNKVFYEIEVGPSEQTRVLWSHEMSILFGAFDLGPLPLGTWILAIEDVICNRVGAWIAIVVSVVLTSFFIPNMMRKGTIDLLIVKPIHRWSLLLMKYVGGLTFIFLNTSIAIGGMWIALGIKSGVWAPGFLLSIPMITFFFAILYAVSTLVAVLTRSPIVCIILTIMVWGFLFLIGFLYRFIDVLVQIETAKAQAEGKTVEEGTFIKTVKVLHRILPRTNDLDILVQQQLRKELMPDEEEASKKLDLEAKQISWGESISVSMIFVVLMLSLSCWFFSRKDY